MTHICADPALPRQIDEVTTEWLSDVLRTGHVIEPGDDASVEILRCEPVGLGETYASVLHRLTLAGPAGTPASLIVKQAANGGLRAMVDAVGAYEREVMFYRELAGETPLSCPRCYFAARAQDSTDFVIVMEDLAPLRCTDQLVGLSLDQSQVMMEELGAAHAWAWEDRRLEQWAGVFPPLDSPRGRGQLEQFAGGFGSTWPLWLEERGLDVIGDRAKSIAKAIPSLMDFFAAELAQPRTITLGDLRADNIFFTASGRPIFVDFQLTQQECGIREVAYLLSQSLTVETRRSHDKELVRQYHEALESAGVRDYAWERAWTQYRIAIAFSLVWPVLASMSWEHVGARGQELLREMVRRASAAIDDVDAIAVLPL
jgi:hypothetical protein